MLRVVVASEAKAGTLFGVSGGKKAAIGEEGLGVDVREEGALGVVRFVGGRGRG